MKIGKAKIDGFIAAEPRLNPYKFYLNDIVRRAAHTLSDGEERILASASVVSSGPGTTYNVLANADFPYRSVTLSDGKTVRLDALADKVLTGDPAALKRYLSFLSAGGSNYPIALLTEAGVDMTTGEPLELTMKKMNQVMDQMEALLK